MDHRFHPFKEQPVEDRKTGTDRAKDPLDVCDLLTESTRKAVITSDGELRVRGDSHSQEKPGIELMKERYWGAEKTYQALFHRQLALETRAMRAQFPGFEMRKAETIFQKHGWTIAQPGNIFWTGLLKTYSACDYLTATVYPSDYPFGEIKSYIIEPFIPATEHRFQDGHLCLYDHQGKGQQFESSKTTAVTVIAWTAAWLHAYEIWCKTGRWPTLEEKKA